MKTDSALFESLQPHLGLMRQWLTLAGVTQAVLYGGALRDTDHGIAFRDIDIGLPAVGDCHATARQIAQYAKSESIRVPSSGQDQFILEGCQGGITLDLNFKRGSLTPEAIAYNADIGLSAIAADLFSGRVFRSPTYLKDVATHTISLSGGWDNEKGYVYATKIQAKYPDRPVVDDATRVVIMPPQLAAVA